MWLFTPIGFFSVVQKSKEVRLTIRARAAGDLDRLRNGYLPELSATVANGGSEYPFRAFASHEQFAEAMRRIALDIDYPHFKNEVARTLGGRREEVLHYVGEATAEIEDA